MKRICMGLLVALAGCGAPEPESPHRANGRPSLADTIVSAGPSSMKFKLTGRKVFPWFAERDQVRRSILAGELDAQGLEVPVVLSDALAARLADHITTS